MLMAVTTGEERRQARPAKGRRNIAVRERRPVGGQSIDVRRGDIAASHEREIAPPHVITHNQDDIGPRHLISPKHQSRHQN